MHKNTLQKNETGLTIIEIIVTIVFVSTIGASLTSYLSGIRATANFSHRETLAALAAEEKLEDLRNSPFSGISDNSFSSDITTELHNAVGSVNVTDVTPTMKLIEISITHDEGDGTRTHEFKSYISTPGITQ